MQVSKIALRMLLLGVFGFGCGGSDKMEVVDPPLGPCETPPRFAYVTSADSVTAHAIDPTTGALTEIDGSPFALADSPRYATIDRNVRFLFSVSFSDSTITVFAIDEATGALAEVLGSPFNSGTNPDSVAVNSDASFLYVGNFNSQDISVYSIASDGNLTPIADSPFAVDSEVTALAFSPSEEFLYVNTFAGMRVFSVDATSGAVTAQGTAVTDGGVLDEIIKIIPNGGRLYGTFSLGAQIAGYAIEEDGSLTGLDGFPAQQTSGTLDRALGMDRLGSQLLSARINGVFGYTIAEDGDVAETSGPLLGGFQGLSPVFESSCQFAYVLDPNMAGVRGMAAEGFEEIENSPFLVQPAPLQILVTP